MWIFFYLYCLYQDYKKSRRVKPDLEDTTTVKSESTQKTITYRLQDAEYYRLVQNLRNCQVLSKNETDFLGTMEKENLLEIIAIYNENMKTMNDILFMITKI